MDEDDSYPQEETLPYRWPKVVFGEPEVWQPEDQSDGTCLVLTSSPSSGGLISASRIGPEGPCSSLQHRPAL